MIMRSFFLTIVTLFGMATGFVAETNSRRNHQHETFLRSTSVFRQVEVVEESTAFEKSSFPIAPDALIARAKEVLGPDVGVGTKDGGECLSDDFEFCAAVVGPLPKAEYLSALGSFKLEDSFDIQQNIFGFQVDPLQPNRVWFLMRQTAKHVKDFAGVQAEGKELELPPQMFHLDFDKDGKVREFGFYTVDRRQGNTGGLGGAFGYFYGVGKDLGFPEAQPFRPSFRFRMLQKVGALLRKLQRGSKE